MTRRFAVSVLPILGILLLVASFATAAEDFLKLVPDSAWGFVAVNQPTEIDAKVQALGREMQLPLPSLLEIFKQKSGVQEGLDEKGTIVLLALPPEKDGAAPLGVLLIPVTDYTKFLAQLNPESTTDGVSKVKLGLLGL